MSNTPNKEYALTEAETSEAILDWLKRNRGYTQTKTITVSWSFSRLTRTVRVEIEEE